MHHHIETNSDTFFYWVIWSITFVFAKVKGAMGLLVLVVPEVKEHSFIYLPQLKEVLPAMILAAICAVVSFLFNKLAAIAWNEFLRILRRKRKL